MKIKSIQIKIISVLLIILALSVFLSIYFTILNQRNNLLDASQQMLAVNTQVLNNTIRNIMLSGEAPLANKMMGDLREMEEFIEYEIYRRDGTPAFSNYETLDFVNDFQDEITFNQTPRLEGGMIEESGFKEVLKFTTPVVILDEEAQEMEYYFPILNYADCRVCHSDDHFIRGISHFRISLEDIYQKVSSVRTILTSFFLVVGVVIFIWVLMMMRRIIIRPIFSIGKVVSLVGSGNLDVRIDMKSEDELGRLAGQINKMIRGLKESKLIELEKTRIEARFDESRKYLDNIREGLLLLNRDYRITEEYSSFLKELFEKEEIAGLGFSDFIYGESGATEQQRQELEMFLEFLFNNKTAALSMIMEINPVSNLKLKLQSGHEIIVEAGFQRIFDGEDVQNVMVLFQDMTDIVRTKEALEAEKLIRESELEQIAAILQHGPGVFEDFITSADSAYKLILKYEDSLNDENSLGMVFREIHSLKGTARYLKFRRLEEVSHELENHFEQLRKGAEKVLNPEEMQPLIDSMRAEIDSIRTTVERFKQFSIGNGPDDSESAVFKSRLSEMITELAGELDKSAQLKLESNMEIIPGLRKLQPAIFHLVRNAVDHGIEDKFQRTSERKNETAVIGLSFNAEDGVLRIVVSDDGRGIDFDAVEKRAVEKGLLNPGPNDHKQVLTAMFSSGFSSRDVVSTVSGRGVGLDAMQAAVNKLNGKIKVITKKGKGTSFILAIPLKNLEAAG